MTPNLACDLHILFTNCLVVSDSRNTDFFFISVKSKSFVVFSVGTTFLLLPGHFVIVLKLSSFHISGVQYRTRGLIFFCELRCVYLMVPISFSETFCACAVHDAISVLLNPSLNITVPQHSN